MTNKRLFYLALIIATLTIGVVIGTIVSGGVKATGEAQKSAALVIPDPVQLSNAFSQIAAQIDPAVVNINTEATVDASAARGGGRGNQPPADPFDFFNFFGGPGGPDQPDRNFRSRGTGTGFIVDKAGYILTNHHVVEKADKITVRLDDKSEHPAKLIGSDNETDLAVIKIDVGHDLPVAHLGNSDSLKVGDWVLAVGSPFGLEHTVTAGIISAKGRENIGGGNNAFQSFLQTDAAINPGNSGGPLVAMNGDVIGINTAIISENRQYAGLGFALPSNTAVKVYNQLVQTGKVTRGSIGIQYGEQDPALMRALGLKPGDGVLIQDVIPGGPSAKAGLHAGDVIMEIDGTKISSGTVLLDVVANAAVGKSVNVRINRDGKEQTIPVVIGDRQVVIGERAANREPDNNNDQGGGTSQTKLGIRVQGITPDMVRQLHLNTSEGVMITAVDQDSLGEEAGLARGMIITRVIAGSQRVEIKNVDDFNRAERLFRSGTDVAFMVLRRDPNSNQYSSGFYGVTIP
jgi:serine protease Do